MGDFEWLVYTRASRAKEYGLGYWLERDRDRGRAWRRRRQHMAASAVWALDLLHAPDVVGLIEPSKLYGVMAAGRPSLFVGPEASEAARIIGAERCGFVVPNGNARLLAERIGHLADHPHEGSRDGRPRSRGCTARYSCAAAVGRWKQVLDELDRRADTRADVPSHEHTCHDDVAPRHAMRVSNRVSDI